MVQDGLRWSKVVQVPKSQRYLRHLKKIHILHSYGLSAEGARACSKKRKRSTILPFSMDQSFFFVLFFSLCSNLSIWPGRQFVPDGSRCYIPIFDGLVAIIIALYCYCLLVRWCQLASETGVTVGWLRRVTGGDDPKMRHYAATLRSLRAAMTVLLTLRPP